MKRISACVFVVLWALTVPPANGQTARNGWSPSAAEPLESAGEVVLTFTATEPGRIVYYTLDGDCNRNPWVEDPNSPIPPSDCGRPQARGSEDYAAVKGEWVFTEAGSRTIRIAIIDDDRDEAAEEPFGVHASQYDDVAGQTTWYAAVVRIVDDDPRERPEPPTAGTVPEAPADAPPSEPPPAATTSPLVPVPVPAPARGIAPLPSAPAGGAVMAPLRTSEQTPGELEAGPGFELVAGTGALRESGRRSGSASSRSALLVGGAALGSAGVVVARRRRRWSPVSA